MGSFGFGQGFFGEYAIDGAAPALVVLTTPIFISDVRARVASLTVVSGRSASLSNVSGRLASLTNIGGVGA